jgi:molecular chaperone DnaJ
MPAVGRRGRGDQQVVLNVLVPRNLTERQRELLTELHESLGDDNLRQPADDSIVGKLRRAFR